MLSYFSNENWLFLCLWTYTNKLCLSLFTVNYARKHCLVMASMKCVMCMHVYSCIYECCTFHKYLSLLLACLYISSQSSVIRFDKSFLDIDRENVAMMKKKRPFISWGTQFLWLISSTFEPHYYENKFFHVLLLWWFQSVLSIIFWSRKFGEDLLNIFACVISKV